MTSDIFGQSIQQSSPPRAGGGAGGGGRAAEAEVDTEVVIAYQKHACQHSFESVLMSWCNHSLQTKQRFPLFDILLIHSLYVGILFTLSLLLDG